MKITGIDVERCGLWRDFSIRLEPHGLTVLFGPNEAGKTTLMRFIRGVLYGFSAETVPHRGGRRIGELPAGTLTVLDGDEQLRIIRVATAENMRGQLTLRDEHGAEVPKQRLNDLLSETSSDFFERVFAVGLPDLQELATLDEGAVADRVYALSLGVHGTPLLDLQQHLRKDRWELLAEGEPSGRLGELLHRYDDLTREIERSGASDKHSRSLAAERDRLEASITEARQRLADRRRDIRGYQYLEKVYTPWRRTTELRRELDELSNGPTVSPEMLDRYDRLESELQRSKARRAELQAEAARLRKEADALVLDPARETSLNAVRVLLDQRDWYRDTRDEERGAYEQGMAAEAELRKRLQSLGEGWTTERLKKLDGSPDAMNRLIARSRQYQSAVNRRNRTQRKYDKLWEKCGRRETVLNERLKELGLDDASLEQAVQSQKSKLHALTEAGRLRLEAAECQQRRITVNEQIEHLESSYSLPVWVYWLLFFFTLGGAALVIAGIVAAVQTGIVVGAIYGLLGLTAAGIVWGFKSQYEGECREKLAALRDQRRGNENRLRDVRQAISDLTGQPVAEMQLLEAGPNGRLQSDAEMISELSHGIAEIESLARKRAAILRTRRRLTEQRMRFRTIQRNVGMARKDWCDALQAVGLDETTNVEQALKSWQNATHAQQALRQQTSSSEIHDRLRHHVQRFEHRVGELSRVWTVLPGLSEPLDVLGAWEYEVNGLDEKAARRKNLRAKALKAKREAEALEKTTDKLQRDRAKLLAQAGVNDREELSACVHRAEHQVRITRDLEQAEAELRRITESESELAIVEQDLLTFDPEHNRRQLDAARELLEETELELQLFHESLGQLKQELNRHRDDRTASRLRFDRAQVLAELREALSQTLALELVEDEAAELRRRFEHDHQPAILTDAARYLDRLTGGRHTRVWSPWGERQLKVDDAAGQTLPVELLSGGTREQLFLSIRLAIVEQMRRQGIELPLVLDDVTVNFDDERNRATIDMLLDAAGHGQQTLLFTSQIHSARAAEERGLTPLWLPARQAETLDFEERRAG